MALEFVRFERESDEGLGRLTRRILEDLLEERVTLGPTGNNFHWQTPEPAQRLCFLMQLQTQLGNDAPRRAISIDYVDRNALALGRFQGGDNDAGGDVVLLFHNAVIQFPFPDVPQSRRLTQHSRIDQMVGWARYAWYVTLYGVWHCGLQVDHQLRLTPERARAPNVLRRIHPQVARTLE